MDGIGINLGELLGIGSLANPWMNDAACREADPNLFFPDKESDTDEEMATKTEVALDICDGCPVVKECLEFAVRTDTFYGIFGGKTEKERRDDAASKR